MTTGPSPARPLPGGIERVVCLSTIPWTGQWTSRHEITAELAARGAQVVFVDPPRNAARRMRPSPTSRALPAGVTVTVPPPYLPYGVLHRLGPVATAVIERNAVRYAAHVAGVLDAMPPARTLLCNSFQPVLGHRVAAAIRPDVHLYHRADDLASFPTARPGYAALEADVIRDADVVVAVTPAIRDAVAHLRDDIAVVRNGVDLGRFADAADAPHPVLARLPRPVAVVVGRIDHRVDRSILAALARSTSLVVAGPVDDATAMPDRAHALGEIPPGDIPRVLAGADVAVVPYGDVPGDPLKVYEYLAAGLPVVGVRGPWSDEHPAAEALDLVDDPADIADRALAVIERRTPSDDHRRRTVAERQSWRHRVDDLLALVADACGVAA